MSAFITRRGGASSGGGSVVTGVFAPTSATKATIPDLIGKSRFVISTIVSGSSTVGIMQINYADGQIRQNYKGLNSSDSATYMYLDSVAAGSDESAAYFDPVTGTIDVSVINSSRGFNTSKTYEYVIFG